MDEKFLVDGRAVSLIAQLPDGRYLVDHIYEYEEDEYCTPDTPFIVEQVFDKPPVAKLNTEIAELQAEIERLEEKRQDLSDAIANAIRSNDVAMKKYCKFAELKELNDFIDGKITHYLITDGYRPEIVEFRDTKSEYTSSDKKLLTLFGSSKGELRWKLNQYSDGSGSNRVVIPCTSLEDALEKAQQYIDGYTTDEQKYASMGMVEFAKQYGLRISAEYVDRCKQRTRRDLESRINEAAKRLEDCKKELEAL
jgi:uncharacterized small protein (DUF1192 family)